MRGKLGVFISCFLLVSLIGCKSNKHFLADIDNDYIYINKEDKTIDQEVEDLIRPYRKELSKEMDIVLIQNKNKIEKGRPNSTMGNWVSDILLDYVKSENIEIDFAVQNQGGLRTPYIGVGDVTIGKIFELMPFDNMLVVLEADGSVVQTFCNHISASGGWPLSRGIEFTMTGEQATNILIGGQALDMEKTYRFAVPDYIANGGSDCKFFIDIKQENLGVFIRDLIIEDTKARGAKGEILDIQREKRIHG